MSADVLKQFGMMGIGLKKQQCGHADAGRDVVDAGLMKRPCGDAGMPAPCIPWGGDIGDYLSFVMPDSCSACQDDDPKKLSLAQQNDDVSSAGRQSWSNIAGLV